MSDISRKADTYVQELAIRKVERWAKKYNYRLIFGTTIGKHPQTVILDHSYQDSCCFINADGKIELHRNKIESRKDFEAAIIKTVLP